MPRIVSAARVEQAARPLTSFVLLLLIPRPTSTMVGFFALSSTLALVAAVSAASNSIPVGTVRGVNLGGLFVAEPWMMNTEWERMGCGAYKSEFDCMMSNSSAQAGEGFGHDTLSRR